MIQGFDPRTGEPVGEPVAETTDAEVDAAVAAAVAAAPAWGAFPRRAEALEAVADALDARVGELAAIADTETALGGERLTGEVARTTGQLRLFAGVLRDGGYVNVAVTPAEGVVPDLRRVDRPVGPVAVFAASNFPFAFSVAGGDTASALAAGCPVVVKAHEGHPVTSDLTAEIVAAALASAGAPSGAFGLIHGVQAGLRLLRHPAIAAAGFTGSTGGGLALAKIAAERPVPIPFYGELGSVNPSVVLPGAAFSRPAAIATGYTGSLTLGTGQFCTNPGLLFVPEDVGLLSAIGEAVGASSGGAMLTGRIFAGFQDAVEEAEEHPGVTELAAGQPGPGPWGATPRVFQLTLKEFADDLELLSRERFGPAGLVITYPSVEDLLPVLAALAGNLVGTVHVDTGSPEDLDLARPVVAVLEHIAGRVVCNGWPTGVAVVAAQHHGGPWPATTMPAYTSVGTAAIRRWLVPVAYQDFPPELLPARLRLPAHGHRCDLPLASLLLQAQPEVPDGTVRPQQCHGGVVSGSRTGGAAGRGARSEHGADEGLLSRHVPVGVREQLVGPADVAAAEVGAQLLDGGRSGGGLFVRRRRPDEEPRQQGGQHADCGDGYGQA
ncbi:MAG TPA: aldehyde dehydrogenase (NADP(+)), partial [Streptosporangiaceae bacterium]|nr:aldehyde dehydrogenase (NADP(+)) [Streptosporangiaceae bacterium]